MPVTVGSCFYELKNTETIDLSIDIEIESIACLRKQRRELLRKLSELKLRPSVRIRIGCCGVDESECDESECDDCGSEFVVEFDPRESCRVLVTRRDVERFVGCFYDLMPYPWSESEFLSNLVD